MAATIRWIRQPDKMQRHLRYPCLATILADTLSASFENATQSVIKPRQESRYKALEDVHFIQAPSLLGSTADEGIWSYQASRRSIDQPIHRHSGIRRALSLEDHGQGTLFNLLAALETIRGCATSGTDAARDMETR